MGITLQWKVWRKRKKIRVLLFFILIPHIQFQDPISNCSWLYAKHNGRTQRPKPICPLNLLEVGGIINMGPLIFHTNSTYPISNRSWPYAKCNPRTHGQAQTNMISTDRTSFLTLCALYNHTFWHSSTMENVYNCPNRVRAWQNQQNHLCAQQRLKIRLGICTVWSESSLSTWATQKVQN